MTGIDINKISKSCFLMSNILDLQAINSNNANLNNIRSKYIIKKVFEYTGNYKAFKIIKENRNLQKRTGLNIKKIIPERSQLIISTSNKSIDKNIIENYGFQLIFKKKNKSSGFIYYFVLKNPIIIKTTYSCYFSDKFLLNNFSNIYRNKNESIYKVTINLENIFEKLNNIYKNNTNDIKYIVNCYEKDIKNCNEITFTKENTYLDFNNIGLNIKNLSILIIKTHIPIKVRYCKYIFNKNFIKKLEGLKDLDFSESLNKYFISPNEKVNIKNTPSELLYY